MIGVFRDIILVGLLTLTTQIGGVAWLVARFFKRPLIIFLGTYILLTSATLFTAPIFGRVPLTCIGDGPLKVGSLAYCALNRQFVTPEMASVLEDTASELQKTYPNIQLIVLDANFPFFDGFPLAPHLSHDDGKKADLALFYRDETGYLPGKMKSPIGYFAFEQGPTNCPDKSLSLRWDMQVLQPLWPDYQLDEDRTKKVLDILVDDERVGKIFLEPHLKATLEATSSKIRFQGCQAARHDDHIHLQL